MCAKPDTTGLLADVTYAVFHGDGDVGHEHCRLYRRAGSDAAGTPSYWMTDDGDLTWPSPHAWYVEICAGKDWRVESLNVRLFGNVQRDATYHAEGSLWRATIQTDEATIERMVPFGPETLVEFDSVWLNTLALNRLKLAAGQAREVDVIRVKWPLLEPVPGRLRYECLGPERITTLAGEWDAMHYVVSGARHLWADSREIVVATRQVVDGLPHGHGLLEYHWLG